MSDTGHTDLLPCPFCGSANIDPSGWTSTKETSGPACDDCGAFAGSIRDNPSENIAAWNRRATDPDSKNLSQALEQVQRDCQSMIDRYERNGPSFTSPSGDEYEPTSFLIEIMHEIISHTSAALASIKGGE